MRRYLLALLAACCVNGRSSPRAAGVPPSYPGDCDRSDALRFRGSLRSAVPLGPQDAHRSGAVFSNAKYRHAANETGPGHSALMTGSDPLHSGIVANDWWDPYLGRIVNVIDDPVQTPLGGSGRASSPANLLTFTVGDVMKSRNPRTRVVGVGMKDRSAILMAGRRGDAAYWFENAGGHFITSTYYMDAAPAWLNDWNRQRHADKFAGQTWNRLIDDAALYEKYAGKDAIEGERDRIDITFPHPIVAKPRRRKNYASCGGSRSPRGVLVSRSKR